MNKAFYIPERPYGPIEALNRRAAALGSPAYAAATEHADYNGHCVRVGWNEYRKYYIAQYTWAGRVVLCRGSFQSCLKAAVREYEKGAVGASVVVGLRPGDEEALKVCEAHPLLQETEGDRSWYTWRHRCAVASVRDYALPNALRMNFDWSLLQEAETKEEYEEALNAKFGRVHTFG